MSTPIFSNKFFKLVEVSEYRKPISAIDSANAIVVLSGMLAINEVVNSTNKMNVKLKLLIQLF
jgi:hypothetical protein